MLAVRLPVEIERSLDVLAKRTGRSKSYYVRAALVDYLGALDGHRVAEPRGTYVDNQGPKTAAATGMPLQLTAVLLPTEGGFVAFNPETGTTSQGAAIADALANLREATELYLEEFPLVSYGRALLTTFEVKG